MSARALETALAARGIDCEVEAHDSLAVLIPRGASGVMLDGPLREHVLRLGREHGFTHVAVELPRRAAHT